MRALAHPKNCTASFAFQWRSGMSDSAVPCRRPPLNGRFRACPRLRSMAAIGAQSRHRASRPECPLFCYRFSKPDRIKDPSSCLRKGLPRDNQDERAPAVSCRHVRLNGHRRPIHDPRHSAVPVALPVSIRIGPIERRKHLLVGENQLPCSLSRSGSVLKKQTDRSDRALADQRVAPWGGSCP